MNSEKLARSAYISKMGSGTVLVFFFFFLALGGCLISCVNMRFPAGSLRFEKFGSWALWVKWHAGVDCVASRMHEMEDAKAGLGNLIETLMEPVSCSILRVARPG